MSLPTVDADIIARLDAGDIEGAAALAAKLPKPADYLRAMREINAVVQRGTKGRSMQPRFSLSERRALITHYELDKRVSDKPDEVAPAIAVVSFRINLAAEDALPGFSPTLRNALFHTNGALTHDLASETNDAPDVRYPNLLYPLKWKAPDDYDGSTIVIHKGLGGTSDLELEQCAISTFEITPKQGGQTIIEFTARSPQDNANANVFGRLAAMLKTEQDISFEPPEEPDDGGEE